MVNKYYIIDTNVFVAANGGTDQLSEDDINRCKSFVALLFSKTIISIDAKSEIFSEYFRYMNRSGQPGIGDAYVKYLWDRQCDKTVCELVDISKNKNGVYKQLKGKEDLICFDPNDLKFIAVYLGSKFNTTICNASDRDWEENKSLLAKYNINVLEVLQEPTP